MIFCRNCIHWVDESLLQIEADTDRQNHIFMGCRIYEFPANNGVLESCPQYRQSENPFTMCSSCHIAVPKVCVSLGECINCTDTDLFCVDHCIGGESRKYCTHFARLNMEGVHLIHENQVFDLFPSIGMPGSENQPDKTKNPDIESDEPPTPIKN